MTPRTDAPSGPTRRGHLLALLPIVLAAGCCAGLAAPPEAVAGGTVLVRAAKSVSRQRLAAAGVSSTIGVVAGTGARLTRVIGDPAVVVARLNHTRGVAWAEPNFRMRALEEAVPDDPLFGRLYGVRRIGAPAFWSEHALAAFPAAGGVPVGIVDTGVDAGHEDLAGRVQACGTAVDGRVAAGGCADAEGHGTHVAGTIGAAAGNGLGIAGVAFNAPLIVCRALGADGSGSIADIAACMRWTRDRGAKVISMSLGGPPSQTLAAAAKTAYARGGRSGSLLVAAAGNEGDATTNYPAGLPQVVSVAAVGPTDAVAPFSNENPDVELAAAGVDVLSTQRGGGYGVKSGTSMAVPHVSAAAALLWAADPAATASRIRAKLDAAVDDLGAPGRDPAYGFGVVDLAKAP
jgi:thermitase